MPELQSSKERIYRGRAHESDVKSTNHVEIAHAHKVTSDRLILLGEQFARCIVGRISMYLTIVKLLPTVPVPAVEGQTRHKCGYPPCIPPARVSSFKFTHSRLPSAGALRVDQRKTGSKCGNLQFSARPVSNITTSSTSSHVHVHARHR